MRDIVISRRRLLVAAGSGVLGVTVLNTLTACSSDNSGGDTPAAQPGSAPQSAAAADLGGWDRVSMSNVAAYVLVRGKEAAIVDLGLANSSSAIEEGLKAAGSGWDQVRHIIITHHHPDHAGGLTGLSADAKGTFYAGEGDVGSIVTDRTLKPVKDGDEVFGLQIIGTPGHTPGHIAVFDPSLGVLVAGDALNTQNGLAGSNPQFTANATQAAESVRKMAALQVKAILPGHGEPLTTNAAEELRKLAATVR
jgi:glyoxylase-like metal-dependent hydrolase (beta-lactamase superfamily II)